jgi:hypothetical protein
MRQATCSVLRRLHICWQAKENERKTVLTKEKRQQQQVAACVALETVGAEAMAALSRNVAFARKLLDSALGEVRIRRVLFVCSCVGFGLMRGCRALARVWRCTDTRARRCCTFGWRASALALERSTPRCCSVCRPPCSRVASLCRALAMSTAKSTSLRHPFAFVCRR